LQTLINTYDSSEFLAKAKLAIADSWFREGGAHGLAQAEAEYKDFELFYPNMPESAEAQERVCDIHYKQMDKADRDPLHAIRAEDECRQLLLQYPNSKFAPETEQKLRNIQEVLAQHEYRTAMFYHHKGSFPAAANRFLGLADQYPLFSQADEALWLMADSYNRMGDRFEDKAAAAYTRIVKDYPLSDHADAAKERLEAMKKPVPQADPVAYARMKYEQENRTSQKLITRVLDPFKKSPNTNSAAKSGSPTMTALRPTIPASVPQAPGVGSGVGSDVTLQNVSDSKELDSRPDARLNPPGSAPAASASAAPATDQTAKPAEAASAQQPFATNHPVRPKKQKKSKKTTPQAQPADSGTAPAAAPSAQATPTAPTTPQQK
jgi:outer membrane protein assembly factor BamD